MSVEKIKEVTLFSKDIELLFNQKVNSIENQLKGIPIGSITSVEASEEIKKATFQKLWRWENLKIDRHQLKKAHYPVVLSPDDALNVLFPGKNMIEYSYFNVSKIVYSIPYYTMPDSLLYGVKGNAVKFMGDIDNSEIHIFFYTQEEITAELGEELQSKRNKILDKIEEVINLNEDYIKNKSDVFKTMVNDRVEEIYDQSKKKQLINSFL